MKYPLLLKACIDQTFGSTYKYGCGHIYDAGFIYLVGLPDTALLESNIEQWQNRMIICLSEEWKTALLNKFPDLICNRRYQMHYPSKCNNKSDLLNFKKHIPGGYRLDAFDEKAYAIKPFGHGYHYPSFEDFQKYGSGFVIWQGEEIVASASSFLTHRNEVELDVSTHPAHRKKGLGITCCAEMLLDCMKRNITVHWDAQNQASRHMAEKLGYSLEHSYAAYSFHELPAL